MIEEYQKMSNANEEIQIEATVVKNDNIQVQNSIENVGIRKDIKPVRVYKDLMELLKEN